MAKLGDEIAKLNEQDTYSLILFALFKLRNIPEYSTLSELVYILDKDTLLKLCEYFGGLTIKIPTLDELESIVYSLVLYQSVDIEGKDYDETIKIIGHESTELRQVKVNYEKISKILSQYNFDRSTSHGPV